MEILSELCPSKHATMKHEISDEGDGHILAKYDTGKQFLVKYAKNVGTCLKWFAEMQAQHRKDLDVVSKRQAF